jgi:predicted metalloendopeptidase
MQRVLAQKDFQTLREVVDHRAWGDLPPTIVNAFYEPSTNAICNILIFIKEFFLTISFLSFSFSSWYSTNAIF